MDFGDGDFEDDGDKDNDDLDRVERWEGVRAASLVDKRHLETTCQKKKDLFGKNLIN